MSTKHTSMDIYATPGTKVVYKGTCDMQISYVGAVDPRPFLVEGQEYTIKSTQVHSDSTYVYIEEMEGRLNSCMFRDVDKILTIQDHIKGLVNFLYYSKGELWYETGTGFEFPVPIDDTGDGIFLARDRAMLFMRYIRKHLANIEAGKKECKEMSDESKEYWEVRNNQGYQEAHDLFM